MIRKSSLQGKFQDIEAVCNIARTLLGLDDMTGVRGTLGLLAVDFIAAPTDVTVEDLLQVHPGTSKALNISLTRDFLALISSDCCTTLCTPG